MRSITLLNEKGGVGKSTLATTIAAGLALKGHRVVMIDADAQANATIAFGLQKEPGFYDLVVRNAQWRDILRVVPPERYAIPDEVSQVSGQLMVVPSNLETRAIALNISDAFAVLNRVQQLRQAVDFVVIDTAPTPSLLHASIYMTTDWILYPTRCETWSFDGLKESLSHREQFNPVRQQHQLPPVNIAGIVPTMYKKKTLEHRENLERLQQAFGDLVWSPIEDRTLWAEAASARRPVFSFAPETKAAREAWEIVNRVEAILHEPA